MYRYWGYGYNSDGQGEVFKSICDFFKKYKIKIILLKLEGRIKKVISNFIYNRKTMKTTIPPILFGGWKGGR